MDGQEALSALPRVITPRSTIVGYIHKMYLYNITQFPTTEEGRT